MNCFKRENFEDQRCSKEITEFLDCAGIAVSIFYVALPQRQGHHNSVSQLLWAHITYPTLSTFPVGGNRGTRIKPTTFGRALTLLFSHEDWVRIHLTGDRT